MAATDPPPDSPHGPPTDLLHCPCCLNRTLTERDAFEICPECGWEDDGQDDSDADVVRGGPNGSLSLTRARSDYFEALAAAADKQAATRRTRKAAWTAWRPRARRRTPGTSA